MTKPPNQALNALPRSNRPMLTPEKCAGAHAAFALSIIRFCISEAAAEPKAAISAPVSGLACVLTQVLHERRALVIASE